MVFDAAEFSADVARILSLDGGGMRLMPLASGSCSSAEARRLLSAADASKLFPGARAPEAALSGLWLYFSCLDESHSVSQSITTAEGSFWHGIMHRQEPDPGNAAYWFRRVGRHPILPALCEEAASLGYPSGEAWDPFAFIDFVEAARRRRGSAEEWLALDVQRVEWQLLFRHCALPGGPR
ncbi:MAG: hypothetical protein SFV54_03300 [Bryobacteraceae bacterium]|nr:hypothetical protein [Bryobacteraceae bacterium]